MSTIQNAQQIDFVESHALALAVGYAANAQAHGSPAQRAKAIYDDAEAMLAEREKRYGPLVANC